jgi:antitoxin MazE
LAFYFLIQINEKELVEKVKNGYINSMIIQRIKIDKSEDIRIPKSLLEQSGFHDEVEIEIREKKIIIKPAKIAREGWDSAFRKMAEKSYDVLLDSEIPTNWDNDEWEW